MTLALLAAVLYVAAAALQARAVVRDRADATVPGALLALLAAALHGAVHLRVLAATGAVDLHFFAALSLVALGVALLTAGLSFARPVGALGVVLYPIAAVLVVLYAATRLDRTTGATLDWQIQLHAGLALLAYATLSVAALLAIMLWMQERALRRRQVLPVLRAFPPLTLLEALMFRLIAAGFALLTLALLSGVVFVENLFAQHLVHKTVLSLLAWGVFGALLIGRLRYGWRGRRAVRLTLSAMALLGLAFFGSKFVLELVLTRT